MKNILLLTDFSENAKNAIRYALQLLKNDDCIFHILYVHKSSTFSSDDLISSSKSSIYDSIVKKPKEKLELLIDEFQNDNKKHTFHSIVDFDAFTDSINQIILQEKIELVVLGSNGVTGAKEVVFGSNTINVIRKVNCTTLIVPEGYKFIEPKELLLALNPNDLFNAKDSEELLNFISNHKYRLHIIRISEPEHKYEVNANDTLDISEILGNIKYKYNIISDVPMHYAIDCYIQTNAITITALFVENKSLVERFFKGSTTTAISNTIRVPLLVLHR